MNKNNSKNADSTQGVEEAQIPDLPTIEKWMTRDLGTCITFLNALHQDADLRKQMAIFLQGRLTNHVNRPDPAQIKMPI